MSYLIQFLDCLLSVVEKTLTTLDDVFAFVNSHSRILKAVEDSFKEGVTIAVKVMVYFAPIFLFLDRFLFPIRARIMIFVDQVACLVEDEFGDSLPSFKFTPRSVVTITGSLGLNNLHFGDGYVFKIPHWVEVGEVISEAPKGFADYIKVRGSYLLLQFPSSMEAKEKTKMVFYVIDSIE